MTTKTYEPCTPHRVAFLGLGVMGYPMAGHLARAGHHVTVFNRTARKAEQWVEEHGGRLARTPREAAAGAQVVFACVGNDEDLRSVVLGADGAFAGMAPEAILFDNTTASAAVARELAAAGAPRGLHFIDAPVSGGQASPGRSPALATRAPASSPRWSTSSPSPGWCKVCRRASPSARPPVWT